MPTPLLTAFRLTDKVLLALRKINQSIDLHSRYLVKHFGITGPQLMVLREVANAGEMAIGEIAQAVSLSQATITGIIERLEGRGLVARRRGNSDRRRVMIGITPQCSALLEKAPPPIQLSFVQQFDRLQDWEQAMILSALQRIVAMMDAKDIDAAPILATGPIDANHGAS